MRQREKNETFGIARAKQTFNKNINIFTANSISINTKKALIKRLVRSVALYGSKKWTILEAENAKIKFFEARYWRRTLRILQKD